MLAMITTCVRPGGVSYIEQTRHSLTDAGFNFIQIITDENPRLGIVPTFRRAVHASLTNSDTDPVVVFQDDVEVAASWYVGPWNLAQYIESELPEGNGVVALYLSLDRTAPDGWSTIEKSTEYPLNVGACGFVIDAATAIELMRDRPFPRIDRLGSQLVQWCWRKDIPFWVHSPSLLRHMGDVRCR